MGQTVPGTKLVISEDDGPRLVQTEEELRRDRSRRFMEVLEGGRLVLGDAEVIDAEDESIHRGRDAEDAGVVYGGSRRAAHESRVAGLLQRAEEQQRRGRR